MTQYVPAAVVGACGIGVVALGGRLLRPRFPICVNCWFCNKNSIVPYGNRNCWDCPYCDQYNGFDQDGNYNKAIPAQFSESLNSLKGCSSASHESTPQRTAINKFCADCNRNQLIKIKQLAAFTPLHEDTFDEEVDRFKQRLDVSLALCGSCQAKAEAIIDQQNRSLMYDIAADAIFKTKRRRSETRDPTSPEAASENDAAVETLRRRRLHWAAKTLNLLLLAVAAALALSHYSERFDEIRSRIPSAPSLSSLPPSIGRLLSSAGPRSLTLVFVGVFLSLGSVSLKNEARVYAGYLDLAAVMSWLSWLVAKLIVDHALHLPASASPSASAGRLNWVSRRIEFSVYPVIIFLAVFLTFLNFVAVSFQKSKSWRAVKKRPVSASPGTKLLKEKFPNSLSSPASSIPTSPPTHHGVDSPFVPASVVGKGFNASPASDGLFPTSTPPSSGSRPASPTGSIVGQGVELRMGDIAGMSLSTGFTPKKKNSGVPRGALFSPGPPASVWGNVGLNGSLSSSGSSLDKKAKTIISPARFTGHQPRNVLPSALFGSSTNMGRPLGSHPLKNAVSRPSSPPGWGRDLFNASGLPADDALSTVSAPSRFAAASGAGLFAGFSPQPSQATTPRGSDNTSNSDHDWPPAVSGATGVDALTGDLLGGGRDSRSPRVSNNNNSATPAAIDDTFTDDSESEESRCLADVTMKNAGRSTAATMAAAVAKAEHRRSRGRRKRTAAEETGGGGHFMKVVAVVSVVANVVLAFYLGTMMKS